MFLIFSFIFNHNGAYFPANLSKVLTCFDLSSQKLLQSKIDLTSTLNIYSKSC